jgi:hypothetical protein
MLLRIRALTLPLALLFTSPLLAQETPPKPVVPAAAPAAAIDPARLAEATKTANLLIPDGVYERVMMITFSDMVPEMFGGVLGGITIGDLDKTATTDANKTLKDAAFSADPHFEERTKIMMRIMGEKMGPLMRKMEPKLREGMAKSYAKKFSVAQLQAMNAFFVSPAGKAYADNYMLLMGDKEAMAATLEFMPEMMTMMTGMFDEVEKATAHLPKPVDTTVAGVDGLPNYDQMPECMVDNDSSDCSPEDRAKAKTIYASLGMDLDAEEKQVEAEKAAIAAAQAKAAAMRAAWSAKDRAMVEKYEKQMAAQQAKADAELSKVYVIEDSLNEAKRNARKNAGQPEGEPAFYGDAMGPTVETVSAAGEAGEAVGEAAVKAGEAAAKAGEAAAKAGEAAREPMQQ